MNIRVLNNDLTSHGIVAGYESLHFTRAFNSKGYFSLRINANNATAKYIEIDKIVYIGENQIGYIDKITYDRKSDKAGEYVIAEGVQIKDRLSRLIYPDAGLVCDSYTNEYLESIIKSLIDKNAGSLASPSRQIPNLAIAANQNRGLQIDYSARYKDISTEIYSLLKSQEMGLQASIDFESEQIVFDVLVGNDLKTAEGEAGGIVLSLDTKTALEIVDTDDKLSYKNLSVTAGLGEGADRTIEEVYAGDEPTGYARCEVFTDARDIESDDEIENRGAQKLSEISKTRAITVKANNLGSYTIGDDYDLGDYISVDAKGELLDAQVIKIKRSYEQSGIPSVDIVLNFDTDDTLLADINAKHMDYDALVASSSTSSAKMFKLYSTTTQSAGSGTGTVTSITNEATVGEATNYAERDGYYINVKKAFIGKIEGVIHARSLGTGLFYTRLYVNSTRVADFQLTHYGSTYTYETGYVTSDLIEFNAGDVIKLLYYCSDGAWTIQEALLKVIF